MVTGNPTQILPQMLVEFSRTGERRYTVTVFRNGYPTIIMDPAPAVETPILDSKLLGRVCARLDEASRQWRSVAIGGSISIKWNDR